MLRTGLGLDDVGTVQSLRERAAAKIAKIQHAVSSENAREKSDRKPEVKPKDSSLLKVVAQTKSKADLHVASSPSTSQSNLTKPPSPTELKERCKKYKGVSFRMVDKKFMASIHIQKTRFLGMYSLASDGAFVYDEIHVKFRGGRGPNFANVQQYLDTRSQEIEDTVLDPSTVDVESWTPAFLRSKAADYYAKIIKDIAST